MKPNQDSWFVFFPGWVEDPDFDDLKVLGRDTPRSKRNTPQKQIRGLISISPQAAARIAARGRVFSPIENLINWELCNLHWAKATKRNEQSEIFFQQAKVAESRLSWIMTKAVAQCDSNTLFEISKAVEYFKKNPPPLKRDYVRAFLIWLREIKKTLTTRPPTLSQIASDLVGLKILAEIPDENGMRVLRRTCRELNFPVSGADK